ncbi:MAG: hypothetical protein IPK08_11705 [Bacteroidetes bacterium]|nr:hypothetical protein [Bacteroidota bacterium]
MINEMLMQEKGRDEVKRNLSENICEQRNANEEKGRDEVKQECKILNVLFSIERKMLNFMVIYLKRKRNIPSPAKDICE